MPAKNRKTVPGWNEVTIFGKTVVSSAAKIQWVNEPSDWPAARCSFGKISEMKTQMTQMMEAASGMDQCLTQEQVDKEDVAAELAKGGGECKWSKKEVGGGKIDVAGTCTQNGQTVDMAMVGTMAAKKTDVTITTKGKVPTGGDMEMVMQMTQTHTGPCKAATTT